MTWVVLGHTFLFIVPNARNLLPASTYFQGSQGLAFEAVMNGLPSVDTFFLMSGTLTAYVVFKELDGAGNDIPRWGNNTLAWVLY